MLIAKIAKRRIFIFHFLYWFAGGGYSHYMLILRIFHHYSALVFEDKAHFVSLKNGYSFSQHDDDDNPLWRRFSLFFFGIMLEGKREESV